MGETNPLCRPVILLTGSPRIGKSTIIQELVRGLAAARGGFYTREVRQASKRIGFEIVTLTGERGILATTLPKLVFLVRFPYQFGIPTNPLSNLVVCNMDLHERATGQRPGTP